ncbi:hypothetical protein O3P69_005145 [Scylla paramamosain]|uniref:Uncharacterized protein n=1 Tax=Scylla paramamosain TaxID=85552 RepID=A0AAW0UDP2_SCYPA
MCRRFEERGAGGGVEAKTWRECGREGNGDEEESLWGFHWQPNPLEELKCKHFIPPQHFPAEQLRATSGPGVPRDGTCMEGQVTALRCE